MSSATSRALLTLLAGGGLCAPALAERPEFSAAANILQVVDTQLSGIGDSVTYTEVSGGGTAQVQNRRIILSSSYRASYRIPEVGDIDRSFSQDGVARLEANIIEQWLSADAGAIITRSRVDPGGAAPGINSATAKNLTQTYSAFVQPRFAHRFGKVNVGATYRYAYTKNDGRETGAGANPLNDRFDSSVNQQIAGTVGIRRGTLPFDWVGSIEHGREDRTNEDAKTRSFRVSGDITMPVGATTAFVASGGYERTRISEGAVLVDPVSGLPIRDDKGRFQIDPTAPRTLTYDMSGLIGDAGIVWRPSRRTRLEARAGYRYGGLTLTGLLEMRPSQRSGLTLIVTDRVESFASSVSSGLAGSSANLDLNETVDPNTSFQNCLFGAAAGSGKCIGGALGGASGSSYRERAVNAIWRYSMRRWSINAAAGYSRRTYIDTPGTLFSLDGVVDESLFTEMGLSGVLTRKSGISFSFRGSLFKNGQVGVADVLSGTFGTNYYHIFGRGIRLQADLAVDASKPDGTTADVSGRAQVSLQYAF